jgi:hypothetical protein
MGSTTDCSYDAQLDLMQVTAPTTGIRSKQDVDAFFDAVATFWKKSINRKVYCIVDYTGFSIDKAMTEYWGQRVKDAVDTFTITTVRYSGDALVRTVMKTVAMKVHTPSNMYGSRDDALQVVRGLRDRSIALAG